MLYGTAYDNHQSKFQIKTVEQLSDDQIDKLEQATWSFQPEPSLGSRIHNPPPFIFCTPYTSIRTDLTKTKAFKGHSKLARFVETWNKSIPNENNPSNSLAYKDITAVRKWQCGLILNRAMHKLTHKQLSNPGIMHTLKRAQFFCATDDDIQQIKKWIKFDLIKELKPNLKATLTECFNLMSERQKQSSTRNFLKISSGAAQFESALALSTITPLKRLLSFLRSSSNLTPQGQNKAIYYEAKMREQDIHDYTGVKVNLNNISFTDQKTKPPRNTFVRAITQTLEKDRRLGTVMGNDLGILGEAEAASANIANSIKSKITYAAPPLTLAYWCSYFKQAHMNTHKNKQQASESLLHELTHSAQTALQESEIGFHSLRLIDEMKSKNKHEKLTQNYSTLTTGLNYFAEGEAVNVQRSIMSSNLPKYRRYYPPSILERLRLLLNNLTPKQRQHQSILECRKITKYMIGETRVRRLRNQSESAYQTVKNNASLQALMFLDKAIAMQMTESGSIDYLKNNQLNAQEKNNYDIEKIRTSLQDHKMKAQIRNETGDIREVAETLKDVCPALEMANFKIEKSTDGKLYALWEFTKELFDASAQHVKELHDNLDLKDNDNIKNMVDFYFGEAIEEINPSQNIVQTTT